MSDVLVVGDWIVGHYLVTTTHRTRTASRVGREQLRTLHGAGSTVQALVGAGRIASLLRQAQLGNESPDGIIGLGVWHKNDTDYLEALINPKNAAAWNPNQISRPLPKEEDRDENVKLMNLAEFLPSEQLPKGEYGTTQVKRLFRRIGDDYESIGSSSPFCERRTKLRSMRRVRTLI